MSRQIGDPTFKLNVQARAILLLLSEQEPHWAEWSEQYKHYEGEFETYPWYNGRERGFALVYQPVASSQDRLVIICAENRNSDQVFLDVGEVKVFFDNGVAITDEYLPYEQMWQNRITPGGITATVEKVMDLCEKFYTKIKAVQVSKLQGEE